MLTIKDEYELAKFSSQTKIEVMRMMSNLGVGHLGGALSITDLLSVLYNRRMKIDPNNPTWGERDWLVVSKGHAGPAVYAALALKGYFPKHELLTLNQPRTNLPSHCDRNKTVGIDMTTGSLGQGASLAAGVALAYKMKDKPNNVYLVLGDGECNEGQVWEMAMFAAQFKLDNLIAFIDNNRLQLDGPLHEVMDIGDVAAKFRDFGWIAQDIDGHNFEEIDTAINNALQNKAGKPNMIVLNSVKGHGWSAAENKTSSHSMSLTKEHFEDARAEINEKMRQLLGDEFDERDYC